MIGIVRSGRGEKAQRHRSSHSPPPHQARARKQKTSGTGKVKKQVDPRRNDKKNRFVHPDSQSYTVVVERLSDEYYTYSTRTVQDSVLADREIDRSSSQYHTVVYHTVCLNDWERDMLSCSALYYSYNLSTGHLFTSSMCLSITNRIASPHHPREIYGWWRRSLAR